MVAETLSRMYFEHSCYESELCRASHDDDRLARLCDQTMSALQATAFGVGETVSLVNHYISMSDR